ncbi:uncharacterized protein [Fopius arisanus]|uniref:Fanconi Anaemia group E protein C-terminal domain-containing protein n=1 Tax=Fopius arisanus TaxID=64838 RepID=A0A9R1UBM3_9HYME|nr:PREDICTED: uncharacterized protein LOC105273699 [Fopius arisanus]
MEDDFFGRYKLSNETIEKVKGVREALQGSPGSSDNKWKTLFQVEDETDISRNPMKDDPIEIGSKSSQRFEEPDNDDVELPSTQFYFTQTKLEENNCSPSTKFTTRSPSDIIKSLLEILEARCLDAEDMNDLTDANAIEIVENLAKRLSSRGSYNFCCSICDMETGLGTYYARIMCSKLLFQKMLQLEKNSNRVDLSTITKMAEKFPDDVRKCLVVPLFNANLKNTKIILMLIKSYAPSAKKELISDFLEAVDELQPWHVTVLQSLIDIQLDEDTMTRILSLLVDKALAYADDKNYSQCILSLLKTQSPFTDNQRNMLHEMIITHKTVFKKPMKNLFDKMFRHRDMWHIS